MRCRISHAWVKLSNYGDPLKLLVPSYNKAVTSQKMTLWPLEEKGQKKAKVFFCRKRNGISRI